MRFLKVVYSEILLFIEFRFSPSVSFADILQFETLNIYREDPSNDFVCQYPWYRYEGLKIAYRRIIIL
jgi:hypothetical protein